jgi:hypothetical protein
VQIKKEKMQVQNTLQIKMQITNARKMPAQKRSLHILHVFSFYLGFGHFFSEIMFVQLVLCFFSIVAVYHIQ